MSSLSLCHHNQVVIIKSNEVLEPPQQCSHSVLDTRSQTCCHLVNGVLDGLLRSRSLTNRILYLSTINNRLQHTNPHISMHYTVTGFIITWTIVWSAAASVIELGTRRPYMCKNSSHGSTTNTLTPHQMQAHAWLSSSPPSTSDSWGELIPFHLAHRSIMYTTNRWHKVEHHLLLDV